MSTVIYRGASCRIKFRPLGGISVSQLGTPTIGIYQDNYFISPDVMVDLENNCIYADLTETDTLMMSDGVETTCQAAYQLPDGTTYRFPVHHLEVRRTMMWTLTEESSNDEETT